MMRRLHGIVLMAIMGTAALPAAATPPQLVFTHKDWHLVCDNTRTCRAAGYSDWGLNETASVLLTRKAGPGQPVTMQMKVSFKDYDWTGTAPLSLAMHAGEGHHGSVVVAADTLLGELSAQQVQAVLATLQGDEGPRWSGPGQDWQLSTAGANAVLLKMNEFQGRTGTPGALVRKGGKPESSVLPALAPPVVAVPPLPRAARETLLPVAMTKALLPQLLKKLGKDGCEMLEHPEPPDEQDDRHGVPYVMAVPLSGGKLLVSTLCYRAAYNANTGYWLVNRHAPYRPQLVTTRATAYADGILQLQHKGRGLGDCWEQKQWAWDGRRFVPTLVTDVGPCRGVPGGWDLPTFVATVQHAGGQRETQQ